MKPKRWTVKTKKGVTVHIDETGDYDEATLVMEIIYQTLQLNGLIDAPPLDVMVDEVKREHREERMDELDCEGSA